MKKPFSALAIGAVAALLLTSCSETAPEQNGQPAGEPASSYNVGIAMVLSGAQGDLGKNFVEYLTFGAEDASEEYGFDLNVKSEDALGTAEGGINALHKLVAEGNTPVIITAWSSVVKAMAASAADTGTAVINVAANSPDLAGASDHLANFFPLATVDIVALANYVATEEDKKKAAVLYIDNETGKGAAGAYTESFTAAGGEVVASEAIKPGSVDVSAQVAKVLAANPDTVHVHVLGESPVVFKALDEQKFDGLVTTYTSSGESIDERTASGTAMDGVLYSTLSSAEPSPVIEEIRIRYVEKFGEEPSGLSYAGYVYDSAFLYAEVIQRLIDRGAEVNGSNIIAELAAGKVFDLPVNGEVSFNADLTTTMPVSLRKISSASDHPSDDRIVATISK